MALNRSEHSREFNDQSGNFVKRTVSYEATFVGAPQAVYISGIQTDRNLKRFHIEVTKAQTDALPAADLNNPTDAEINGIADPLATAEYNTWVATLDASVETVVNGQFAQIVP